MGAFEVVQFKNDSDLARSAAEDWLRILGTDRQICAFSGGRIAARFFQEIARQTKDADRPLDQVEFFFADERCVPPDHSESNYHLMRENLIAPLAIPDKRVHRIRGEDEPATAADRAAEELIQTAPKTSFGIPVLDFIFLGMGEDGHVASLFPNDKAITDRAIYRAVIAPKPPPQRITIGLPVILQSTNIRVLVSGAGKEKALAESLDSKGDTPLARVIRGFRADSGSIVGRTLKVLVAR